MKDIRSHRTTPKLSVETNPIATLVERVIEQIGDDPTREGLRNTPQRVARSYRHLFSGYEKRPEDCITLFESERYDEMILAKDIEFYSTCEHHLLPFFGSVHIGYIPNAKIVGISKLPRLIEVFARRLQNQERLTQQIADAIFRLVEPKGVGVVIEARHLCMMARGVAKQKSSMITSGVRGLFKKNTDTRNEFLTLIRT